MLGLGLDLYWDLTLVLLNWRRVMIGLRLLIKALAESYFIITLVVQRQESREHLSVIQVEFISNLKLIIL